MRPVPSPIASPGTIFGFAEDVHGHAGLLCGNRKPVVGRRRDHLRNVGPIARSVSNTVAPK
jgi:hypothetical protein